MFVNTCPRFMYQLHSHLMEFETNWYIWWDSWKSCQIFKQLQVTFWANFLKKPIFGAIFFKNLIFGVKKYKMSYLFQSHWCPMVNYKIWTLFPPNYMVVNILYQILAFPRNTPKNTNCEFIYVKMSLLICLIICIYLYTFEVYIFKISAL